MDKNKRVEIATPVFFIALSIYIFIVALTLPDVEGVFPMMIAVCMLASSVVILVKLLRTTKCIIDLTKINVMNLVKITMALIIYAVIINRVGYIISTVLLGIYSTYALGLRDLKKIVIYPVAIVLVLFVSFKLLLNVPLPMAFLDF